MCWLELFGRKWQRYLGGGLFLGGLVLLATLGASCGDSQRAQVALQKEGQPDVTVVYSEKATAGVKEAATELVRLLGKRTGLSLAQPQAVGANTDPQSLKTGTIIVLGTGLLQSEPLRQEEYQGLLPEEYRIMARQIGGKEIAQVAAGDEVGLQYGVYDLLRRQGIRFFHPAQTYVPPQEVVPLKLGSPAVQRPGFALRGFHHHTQHPIPMSVYLLEAKDKNLERVKEYLRWLVRNRQNVLQWHLLKTVDRDKWIAYAKKISELARPYGIQTGIVLSFADQQQNNFRLIQNLKSSAKEQTAAITKELDWVLQGGFSLVTVQFGTSEFSRVKDEVALRWLNTAASHLKKRKIPLYAWIHTAGELKADDGESYFYHLPEKAEKAVGAYVHTTMFYDLFHPAPVYNNKDFSHQRKFLERNLGKRSQVYFPETAWWLGFDVNLPLALPITGYSRTYDILQVLQGKKLKGHVTFTSGMEWGYWKYDHVLSRVTWDRSTTWNKYLTDYSSIFGEAAQTVRQVLQQWTALQVRDFYGEQPELYFYIAGELAQDEIGLSAGILARHPKRPFREILNLSAAQFKTWRSEELEWMQTTHEEYKKLFARLPQKAGSETTPLAQKLYLELYTTLQLYVWRVEHTYLLYDAVRLARQGREDGGSGADPDEQKRKAAQKEAEARLQAAAAITTKVLTEVARIEKEVYRYPREILATKRTSLTAYKFGYLWETSTGHFWTRRDKQAKKLLQRSFGQIKEEWEPPAPAQTFYASAKDLTIQKPDSSMIRQVLQAFIPGFLVAVPALSVPEGPTQSAWRVALDHNENKKPDIQTAVSLDEGKIEKEKYQGGKKIFPLPVIDKAGNEIGTIGLQNTRFTFVLTREKGKLKAMVKGTLEGEVLIDNLVAVATQIAGLDREGLLNILGSMLGFDPKSPPPSFPITVGFNKFSPLP